jgi:hypothetical protein
MENSIYLGICEDNSTDPLKMGRIKVRVFGIHTEIRKGNEDFKGIKTEDLPWALPVNNFASIDGISNFSVPENGSTVLVTFLDVDKQNPIYFGSIPRTANVLPDFNEGFSDPDKVHPSGEYIKESPLSRLARNEKIDQTIVQTKKDNVKAGITTNKTSFNEPVTTYDAVYPDNQVIETASGHVIELDDTEGAERVHIYHKSGTFIEMFPDGKLVQRVEGSSTSITISDNNILVEGNQNIRVKGNEEVQIDGVQEIKVGGNVNLDCGGHVNIKAASGVDIDGGGSLAGVVTGNHICHYTGSPHGSISGTVKASK